MKYLDNEQVTRIVTEIEAGTVSAETMTLDPRHRAMLAASTKKISSYEAA